MKFVYSCEDFYKEEVGTTVYILHHLASRTHLIILFHKCRTSKKTTMAKAQIEDILVEDERRSDESKATMPMSLAALSDAEFASVGRKATVKMDIMIMPCLVIMYIMNYLDRQNIAAAKLADIDKDLRALGCPIPDLYQLAICGIQ